MTTLKPTFGYGQAGRAGRGYTSVKGLNALLGIVSTPGSAAVMTGARLRKASTNTAKGAHRFGADTLGTAKAAGATGVLVARLDSAFYQGDVISAVLRHKARPRQTAFAQLVERVAARASGRRLTPPTRPTRTRPNITWTTPGHPRDQTSTHTSTASRQPAVTRSKDHLTVDPGFALVAIGARRPALPG